MIAVILATAIDVQSICAKYEDGYTPPPAAVAAEKECGEGCERDLAEDFANGEGVERNFGIAEYFLCRAAYLLSDAEQEGMMEHLQRMRGGEETADLDYCDHVTSGAGSALCTSIEYDRLMPQLESRIGELRERIAVKAQFDALRSLGDAYATAEAERIGEQSRGGTGYQAISLAEEMNQKERFVEALERYSSERAPAATAADLARADAELNEAYRAAMRNIDVEEEYGREWRTYLRNAQRAWIAYRDAFARYYAARWRGSAPPAALRHEIVTQLTRERTEELRPEM